MYIQDDLTRLINVLDHLGELDLPFALRTFANLHTFSSSLVYVSW